MTTGECGESDNPRQKSHPAKLTRRIDLSGGWKNSILQETDCRCLQEIANRWRLMAGTANSVGKSPEKGTTILFVGPGGTGKTMAAALLANDLNFDLFRIDLSRVVSKYIGETEKNLKRLFDEVENSNAVLLFDEADELFGQRSEMKDSRNRCADLAVAYLLQRMEAYHGLTVLAINHTHTLDKLGLGRFDCIVEFRDPDNRRIDD